VPVYQEYMNPILDVLRREGRSLTIEQLDRHVIAEMKLAHDVATIPHDVEKPDRSEVSYRIAWSRTYLTANVDATPAVVEIRDPVRPGSLGYVELRPLVLRRLVEILVRPREERERLARALAFGSAASFGTSAASARSA